MTTKPKLKQAIQELGELVGEAKTILVLQPEKPDTDSLGSSLALEDILETLGKKVVMYSKDGVPDYIRYFDGWDRVTDEFPTSFDLTLLVDTGGPQMLTRTLEKYGRMLSAKPFAIIDHHKTREAMPFAVHEVVDTASAATGELLVVMCEQLNWHIGRAAAKAIVPSIMADTLGLSTPTTTADTVEAVAKMVRAGADLYELRRKREVIDALEPDLLNLKGELLKRITYHSDGRIATLIITPQELKTYADRHDPADLVNQEMRTVKGVQVAAILRDYNSSIHGNKIKISMRANTPVAALAAKHFGGGGHDQAAGCAVEGRDAQDVVKELVGVITKLLDEHEAN